MLVDLKSAKHRQVDMASADETKRHGAVEGGRPRQSRDRSPTRVGEPGQRQAGLGIGPVPMSPFSDWKKT